jgi:hypothetical protein
MFSNVSSLAGKIFAVSSLVVLPALADSLGISTFSADGTLNVTNAFTNGVVTIERASAVEGPWLAEKNAFSSAPQVQLQLAVSNNATFFRALAVDLSGPGGFTNLFQSYGLLTTIAGSGNIDCTSCNNWWSGYEGGLATEAVLSSPHIAMADRAGNLYIADKRAHAIRKVTPNGRIVTVAGTSVAGYGDTNAAPATSVPLNNPNGLYVFGNGLFYILDRDNGLIRRVGTNGIMTAIVNHGSPITGGRGLWVSPDESLLYYSAGSTLMRWDSTNGLAAFVTGFTDLGNIAMDPQGRLVVTDAGLSQVFRIEPDGSKTVIAGNGTSSGGGDGQLAIETGLYQVRGIWYLPTGGFFLATDAACQVWYVDTTGTIHHVLSGSSGAHSGDGAWFYDNPTTPKISNGKQVTMDYDGNLIITESEFGYVRKIQFLRHGQ